jgi:hypothetical protein
MSRATRANVVVSQVIPDFTALTINTKNEATTTPQHPKHVVRTAPQHHKLVFYDAEDIMMPKRNRGPANGPANGPDVPTLTPELLRETPVFTTKDDETKEREKQMKIKNFGDKIYKNANWLTYYPTPIHVNQLNEDSDVDQLRWTVYDPAKDANVSGSDKGKYWYTGADKVHFLRKEYPNPLHATKKKAIHQFMLLYNETSLLHKVTSDEDGEELSQSDLDMLALKLQVVTQGKTCYGISLPPGFLPCVQVTNDREPLTTPRKWDTFYYGPIWDDWKTYNNEQETNAQETNAQMDTGRTVSMRKCKTRKLAWLTYTGLYRTCPELKQLQQALATQANPEQATSSQSAIVTAPVNPDDVPSELPELCCEDERLVESTIYPDDAPSSPTCDELFRNLGYDESPCTPPPPSIPLTPSRTASEILADILDSLPGDDDERPLTTSPPPR